MQVMTELISFLFDMLNISVTIGGYNFSLVGSIIFAGILAIFIGFIKWLIGKE